MIVVYLKKHFLTTIFKYKITAQRNPIMFVNVYDEYKT